MTRGLEALAFDEEEVVTSGWSARGGRLCLTSLAAMTLEVYYRYMPIYQTEAVVKEFPE